MNLDEQKSAVQRLRERHGRIKASIKPSKELLEIFGKKEELRTEKQETED